MNEGAQLFTVRVWRRADQFRAVVRAVGGERSHLFTAAAPLAAFLREAAAAGPLSAPPRPGTRRRRRRPASARPTGPSAGPGQAEDGSGG